MPLNKQKGNMYPWVDFTWNPVRGRCPHQCDYCFMKDHKVGELRLAEKCFNDRLGENRSIFVGSSCDMFAELVPTSWIRRVLDYCGEFPSNEYLFQTKNPGRLIYRWAWKFPDNTLWGTTLESNRDHGVSLAPPPHERFLAFNGMVPHPKMVSIEPIMDFDLDEFATWIQHIGPRFVSIGADSKGHHLPEPGPDKIAALITELERFTVVKQKSNLKRLLS